MLGVGGVRLLAALGLRPTVWHINEGHASFWFSSACACWPSRVLASMQPWKPLRQTRYLRRIRRCLRGTIISARNDGELLRAPRAELGVKPEVLLALGRTREHGDFNMTALAIRGSRFHNGVSRIHGGVSAEICADMWPEIEPEENPLTYITNGVHVPTFSRRNGMRSSSVI